MVEFADVVTSRDGVAYTARACGGEGANGLWQGWIEFIPVAGGDAVRSGRETTQPNRQDAVYWATGLTPVYLEGALARALNPLTRVPPAPPPTPIFDGPTPDVVTEGAQTESVLNPFSVYRKGEALLRSQLGALSAWHLVNIIRAYALSDEDPAILNLMAPGVLAEIIVAAVRARNAQPTAP
jgi:hypothetical protein